MGLGIHDHLLVLSLHPCLQDLAGLTLLWIRGSLKNRGLHLCLVCLVFLLHLVLPCLLSGHLRDQGGLDILIHQRDQENLGHPCLLSESPSQVVSSVLQLALEDQEVLTDLFHPSLLWALGSSIPCFPLVRDYLEDLNDPRSLWVLEDRVDPANRRVRKFQEFLVIRAIPLLLSLQSDWWRSRHLGRPFVLADQVDPIALDVREFLNFLGNLCHPLSHCNLPLLSGLKVRPARADQEVLVFLGILAIQTAL